MKPSLLAGLAPRVEPEQRPYRLLLARWVIGISLVLVGVWWLADLGLALTDSLPENYNLVFDAAAGVGLLLLCFFTGRAVRQGRVLAAGYGLAAGYFTLVTAGLLVFPGSLYLYSAGYLLPILIAGGVVAGASTYPFAVGGILAIISVWLRARTMAPASEGLFSVVSGVTFVLAQSLVLLGASGLLQTLSDHLQQTLSMLRNQADRLTELAHTDSLTGLANRRHLIDMLEREFTRARRYHRPLSLLYLDLDGFKAINDRFGHMFGDEILRGVAIALRAVLRSTDVLARFGGDEFAVLLPETNLEGSMNVAEKLRKALASYGRQLGPMVPLLTFCAGASQLLENDTTVDDVLSRADQAQYLAKDTGKAHTRTQRELPQPAAVD